MSTLNGKGPENKGTEEGRKLGKCYNKTNGEEAFYQIGQGMGKRRQAGKNNINHKQNK